MQPKVLVVDDSRTIRVQVRAALVGAGFDVIEACDGIEGLEKMATTVDLKAVVCDVNMPRMTGLELLDGLPPALKGIPVIMLTTEGQPSLMERARAKGARGWLMKPFKAPLLVAALRKVTEW